MVVSEMQVKPYNVYVTVAYPPDTDTPGFAEENRTKVSILVFNAGKRFSDFSFSHFSPQAIFMCQKIEFLSIMCSLERPLNFLELPSKSWTMQPYFQKS